MIKAIIFDLDGTLIDSSGDINSVLNASLKKFGLAEISIEKTKEYVGNGAKKLVERAIGDENCELLEKVYEDYSLNFANCGNELTKLFDGEEEALQYFNKSGILLAIVTNKPQRATDNVCNKYLSQYNFGYIIGQSEKFPLKPDPASTLEVIEKLNVSKEECIFVGDGETDIETAERAGVRCVSALWGYRSEKQLRAAGAQIVAENFDELRKFAEKENFIII